MTLLQSGPFRTLLMASNADHSRSAVVAVNRTAESLRCVVFPRNTGRVERIRHGLELREAWERALCCSPDGLVLTIKAFVPAGASHPHGVFVA